MTEEFLVTVQTKVRAENDTEALLKGLKGSDTSIVPIPRNTQHSI